MKIFLNAYYRRNLGDDLLIYILANRYPKLKFYSYANPIYKYSKDFSNIKFNFSLIFFCFNKLIYKYRKDIYIMNYAKKFDTMITIGGSIFIESDNKLDNENMIELYSSGKNNFIMGSNFGPYKTVCFKDKIEKQLITKCKDVCFRDIYSYNLFNRCSNVRYAADIVFTLSNYINTIDNNIQSKNEAIISVINCKIKNINISETDYEDLISNICIELSKKGYNITLMSFCKSEGDERTIKNIIKKNTQINFKKYFYRNDITSALKLISNSSIIIGTRFHANILGLLLKKTIIPIIYSNKTREMLDDIDFKGKIIDLENLNDTRIKFKVSDLNYKHNVNKWINDAQKHFETFDEFIKNKY